MKILFLTFIIFLFGCDGPKSPDIILNGKPCIIRCKCLKSKIIEETHSQFNPATHGVTLSTDEVSVCILEQCDTIPVEVDTDGYVKQKK